MNWILVPTDFSSCANKALDYAVCLAKKAGAEVILLHACELIAYPFKDHQGLIEEHNLRLQKQMTSKLQHLKKLIEETEGLVVHTRLYDGDAKTAILFAIRDNAVDLVVMGTLGKSGFERKVLGTKTASIVAAADVPVIAVPAYYTWSEPRKILLALNDPTEDPEVLNAAFEIAKLFDAEIYTAIFSEEDEEAIGIMQDSRNIYKIQTQLNKEFKFKKISTVHLSGTDFRESIQKYINEHDIDLLAMVTHKRNLIQALFNRSITKRMAYHTQIPLLSVNSGE